MAALRAASCSRRARILAPSSSARLRNGALLGAGAVPRSELVGPPAERVAFAPAKPPDSGDAGEGIPAEGAAEAAPRHAVHQVDPAGHARKRQAAAERLPRNDQVRLDA